MIDQITLKRIEDIHPSLREELRQIYKEICEALTGNLGCRFVQVYRTFEEQHQIFLQRPKVTNADAGQSYHNYGLAVDFCLINDNDGNGKVGESEISWSTKRDLDRDGVADWMEVVKIFTKYGWKWGASFGDYPHFEKSPYNWRELLKRYQNKEFIEGTSYLKLD